MCFSGESAGVNIAQHNGYQRFMDKETELDLSADLVLYPQDMAERRAVGLLARKSNKLMMSRFEMTVWELRIFERMVSLIDPMETDFKLCRLYVRDLQGYFTQVSHSDYSLITQAVLSLADKKIQVQFADEQGRMRWAKLSIFPTVTIPTEAERKGLPAYVEMAFHNDLKPYLLQLRSEFTTYSMDNLRGLTSLHAMRLFLLFKPVEESSVRYTMDFLRTILSLDKNEHKEFKDFKRWVLKPAQTQLRKHTDLVFEFFEEKCEDTNRVVAITFVVRRNEDAVNEPRPTFLLSPKAELELVLDKNDGNKSLRWTWQMLRQWGMTEKVFLQVLRTFPFPHIRLCVDFVCHLLEMRQMHIKKPVGYFYTLLKMYQVNPLEFRYFGASAPLPVPATSAPSKTKSKSPQDPVARQAAIQRQREKDEIDKRLTYYRRELFAREERQLDQYMSLVQSSSKAHIFRKARLRPFARFDEKLTEDDNFKFNRFFRFACRAVLEDEMPDFFTAWHNDLREEIYELQQRYKSL